MHYACVSHLWTKDIDLYSGPKVSRQFQFTHGNFNLLTAISIYSWQFQFTHSNFILLTASSIYSRQFFASLTTCQLQQPTVATKSQNAKLKVDI